MEMSVESVMKAMFADMVKQEVEKVTRAVWDIDGYFPKLAKRIERIENVLGLDSMDQTLLDRIITIDENVRSLEHRMENMGGGEKEGVSLYQRVNHLDERIENMQEEIHNRVREVEREIEKVNFNDLSEIDFDKVITERNFNDAFRGMIDNGDIELKVEVV